MVLGDFHIMERIITGLCIAVFFIYLLYRERKGFEKQLAVRNLMGLFPGNLLLLLGISTMDNYRSYLVWAWLMIIFGTMLFDLLANRSKITSKLKKILFGGIYLFIWADIFFLLYMWIRVSAKISPQVKVYLSWGIGTVGVLFLLVGSYRFANLKLARDE